MKRAFEKWAWLAGLIVIAAGLTLLKAGNRARHDLHDPAMADFGVVQVATNITEAQLVEDATFSGVERRPDGRLYSTYERAGVEGPSKQSCPT